MSSNDPLEIQDYETAAAAYTVTNVVADGVNGSSIQFVGPVEVRAIYQDGSSYPVHDDIWVHNPDVLDRILLVTRPDPITGYHAVLYGRDRHPERMRAAWDVIEWLEKYQHRYQAKAVRRMFGIREDETRA